jgi:Tol biopolymer transport system component
MISAEGGEFKPLTKPDGSDRSPAISSDGRTLAFMRRRSFFNNQVMLLPLNRDGSAAGPEHAITTDNWTIVNVAWDAGGDSVLFEAAASSENFSLWRVPRRGGVPVRLDTPSSFSGAPTMSQTGRMVYVSTDYETKIFKGMLGPHDSREPQPLVEAIGEHRDLAAAPDGSRIAFVSSRTGHKEIWTAKADGSGQTQLTYFNGPTVGSPRWSPDGKQIAFDGYAGSSSDLYVVAADGGKPVHLTTSSYNEIRPSWSHDGQWIYYGRDRAGHDSQIWKIRPSGGEETMVSRHGIQAVESPDGQWLYIFNPPNLWRARPDGTQEQRVTDHLAYDLWAIGGSGVYTVGNNSELLRAPSGSDRFEPVYRFPPTALPTSLGPALAMPRDESYFIYRVVTRNVRTLMLVEGLR